MPTPQGFLTDSDKEFLRGETDYEEQQHITQKRYRLRKRIRQAINDFGYLFSLLGDDDRRLIFDDLREDDELIDDVIALLAFTYWVTEMEQGVRFDHLVEQAVMAAEQFPRTPNDHQVPSAVDVDIEVQRTRDMHAPEVLKILKMGPEKAREEGHYITPGDLGKALISAQMNGVGEEARELVRRYVEEEHGEKTEKLASGEPVEDVDLPRWSNLSIEAHMAHAQKRLNEDDDGE